MPTCEVCKREIPRGIGKLFVFRSGKLSFFCSSKCEKAFFRLGKKIRKLKWVGGKKKTN